MIVPLEAHFVDRPNARACFDAIVASLERDGPLTIATSRTRIEFMTRVRFAGVVVRRDDVRLNLWLKRDVDSPRIRRRERFGGLDHGIGIDIRSPDDVDEEVVDLLREARAIGDQAHPAQVARYRRRT